MVLTPRHAASRLTPHRARIFYALLLCATALLLEHDARACSPTRGEREAIYTLDDIFFAGDKGVWRGTWRATHRGEWEGIAPTGRKATWTVIIIGRFAGDKLVEDWVECNRYNLFRQLGAV